MRNLINCTLGMYLFDESSDSYEKFGDTGIFQVVDSHADSHAQCMCTSEVTV